MSQNLDFKEKCNALRAAARQLLKDCAAEPEDLRLEEGMTVLATPAALHMSMGEVRHAKPVTLCTFSRSELMVRALFSSNFELAKYCASGRVASSSNVTVSRDGRVCCTCEGTRRSTVTPAALV
jgi:hypothetical protein